MVELIYRERTEERQPHLIHIIENKYLCRHCEKINTEIGGIIKACKCGLSDKETPAIITDHYEIIELIKPKNIIRKNAKQIKILEEKQDTYSVIKNALGEFRNIDKDYTKTDLFQKTINMKRELEQAKILREQEQKLKEAKK